MSNIVRSLSQEPLRRYKPYPAYKDSGVQWLGVIPATWEVHRLKEVAAIQMSNVDKKSVAGEEPVELCNYTDVYYHERITSGMSFMQATAPREQMRRFALRAGDVLITKDSESWMDIAVPSVVVEDLPNVLCGYHLAHIRPRSIACGPYLARALGAVGPRDQFRVSANGVTRFAIGTDAITTSLFAIPSVAEQRAITTFLDRETARIDELVEKKELLIELLQERRKALITHAVTKGLNPAMPMKDSGVEWLGEIPAHWDVRSLKSVASIRYGLGEPPRLLADGLPFIRATNVAKGRIVEKDLQFVDPEDVPRRRAPRLRTGDIIVVRSGAYTGDSTIIPHDYEGAVAGYDMVVRGRIGHSGFLAWTLLSRYVLESQIEIASLRAAQPHLNAEELGTVRVLYPPAAEQRTIANFLDCETARIDVLIASIHAAITRLHELRAALISAAVTGKIDVREAAQ